MLSEEIRDKFLGFFEKKGHRIVPSDSLVPKADPTLLFTSAGMNQFKEQFLGHNIAYRRAASSQKCLRTADLEKVGKTPSHHTFFEMLGNFSFGDYFKKEAIEWAWEFLTESLSIPPERLWVSVYEDDGESYRIWRRVIKLSEEKIKKFGAEENFWPSNALKEGPNGPCGPCSEIFYDWGDGASVEVWNLVFTQFDRKDGGRLEPLPSKNIDTGMGLERSAAVMQGVKTNFETDLFVPIVAEIGRYNPNLKKEALNAIADHIRAATFAICDGVPPSNEERGYVVRKLIRKAYLMGGIRKPFLYNLVPKVVGIMKCAYPELLEKREEIALIVKEEEERFERTLSVAMPILEHNLEQALTKVLDGAKVFKLVDTYGLPLEIIEEEAKKRKIKVNIEGFRDLMNKRREESRKSSRIEEDIFALNLFTKAPHAPRSDRLPLKAKVAFMVRGKNIVAEATEGEIVEVMTDPQSSSFYAEAGGQVGDTGTIKAAEGALEILNTVNINGRVVHVAKVIRGRLRRGDEVLLDLAAGRKKDIARNHTATHLLQSALRKVLGEHVHQAGSLVAADRLRFDFTHTKKLSDRELRKVEEIVNDCIKKGIDVTEKETALEEARKEGAIALFGEKYKDRVRVVSAGDVSKEVCGGTHVNNTRDIGVFKIIRESSVASGVRRIEALTHEFARRWMREEERRRATSEKLRREKEKERMRAREELKRAEAEAENLFKKAKDIRGIKVLVGKVDGVDIGVLRGLSDRIKSRAESAFVALMAVQKGRVYIVLSATKNLVSRGLDVSKIIKDVAETVGGSGGGRPDFAQAGGREPSKVDEAMKTAAQLAEDAIGGLK